MLFRQCSIVAVTFVLTLTIGAARAQYGPYNSRGLLEKKLYYVDENGKAGTCEFWSLYLGKHSCKITKPFPGEGDVVLDAEVNFNFLSSLYIEGKGYSSRGKIDVDAKFAVPEGDGLKDIEPEQIEYVYDYGAKVKVSNGDVTDLYLHPEGNKLPIRRMLVRIFTYDKKYKSLDFARDIAIKAFSFSKAGIQDAMRAGSSTQ
ncbi:MAG: hypothetical protein GF418_16605 [Chitinivibrionales bacterium]|nr:hypothetical protein [Chitinivibrionales bacterium]MBD3397243.1 hypothetical protein [Chitinivibrionales bacterium]